ncbi:Cytochrome c551 peroxidase [Myxococcus hansupus]|uniref:Cytochrome c551 peroxidase n=1 Tax=Pseudomyxococcus hansupus TaxID=1297742 RepID=A0A0H4XJC4_9BACT|nr:cytochrome c peroxidase [Myxococcus hansupus]AKQ68372.1 Cytochrome c551 peroxidase [Myxococcus hansupus]
MRRGAGSLCLGLLWMACGGTPGGTHPNAPEEAAPRVLPVGFSFLPAPEDNPLTPEGVALGRWLFHSPRLSGNGQVSCATCHDQAHAFSVPEALTTRGVSGRPLARHAPTLINLAWAEGLFWDGGARNLESLSLAPLTHPDEMGQSDLAGMMEALAQDASVARQFEAAFGDGPPTLGHLLRALAQYQRTLVSARSRYDAWRRGETGALLTAQERQGLDLVRTRCAPCHDGELFTDNAFHNNGLDAHFGEGEDESRGRGRVTLREEDAGRYKTPTLRNVAVSAPYMHDGRFATLEDTLRHYRQGVVPSPTLDTALLRDGEAPGIPLNDAEVSAVLAFLHTLTDASFLSEVSLGPPSITEDATRAVD